MHLNVTHPPLAPCLRWNIIFIQLFLDSIQEIKCFLLFCLKCYIAVQLVLCDGVVTSLWLPKGFFFFLI